MAFTKGISGNKAGRPPGRPDRRTKLRELLTPHAEHLIQTVVNAALAGDMTAARLCLDRCCPTLKPQTEPSPINIDMTGSPVEQSRAILAGVADGVIAIDEATQLLQGIAASMKILELTELDARIAALEVKQ